MGKKVTVLVGMVFVALILSLTALCTSCHQTTNFVPDVTHQEPVGSSANLLAMPSYDTEPMVDVLLKTRSKASPLIIECDASLWRFHVDGRRIAYSTPLTVKLWRRGDAMTMYFKNDKTSHQLENVRELKLESTEPTYHFALNGHLYEGSLTVSVDGEAFAPINHVSMSQYVRGAIGWESLPSWHVEALKAQAVAIRSYTLFIFETRSAPNRGEAWDVDDTTAFLRYGGIGPKGEETKHRVNDRIREAQSSTFGEVMEFEGKLLKTYFHSCSGGATTSTAVAFDQPSIMPLAGTDLGNYGSESPIYRWVKRIDRKTLRNHLATLGVKVGKLSRILPQRKTLSGHSAELLISGENGSGVVKTSELRRLVGYGRDGLPSTNFTVTFDEEEAMFNGRGWGHGVGMDQWAAQSMAKDGKSYKAILRKMYPGADIAAAWTKER